MSKDLDIWGVTARVAADVLKAHVILSDTAFRRPAVDRDDLKSHWKSEKSQISLGDQQSYCLKAFQKLHRKKTNRAVVFSCGSSSKIL